MYTHENLHIYSTLILFIVQTLINEDFIAADVKAKMKESIRSRTCVECGKTYQKSQQKIRM